MKDCIEGFRAKRCYSVCLMLILMNCWHRRTGRGAGGQLPPNSGSLSTYIRVESLNYSGKTQYILNNTNLGYVTGVNGKNSATKWMLARTPMTAGGGRRVPPCHLRLARLSPVQLRLLAPPITTLSSCRLPRIRSRTRAQSASLQPPGSVCKHRRFALLKRSYKANQPERNSRLLVGAR